MDEAKCGWSGFEMNLDEIIKSLANEKPRLQSEFEAAKNDIAALIWLNGDCRYCRFGQKDEYCGTYRWTCKLGSASDCRPEW